MNFKRIAVVKSVKAMNTPEFAFMQDVKVGDNIELSVVNKQDEAKGKVKDFIRCVNLRTKAEHDCTFDELSIFNDRVELEVVSE